MLIENTLPLESPTNNFQFQWSRHIQVISHVVNSQKTDINHPFVASHTLMHLGWAVINV